MTDEQEQQPVVIDTPTGIGLYQFAASVYRLNLESKGIRFKDLALLTPFKRHWGYRGCLKSVVEQAEADKRAGHEGRLGDIKSRAYRSLWVEHLKSLS